MNEAPKITVPESELRFASSRSGGAGGQNVNKLETKALVFWNFRKSRILSGPQKELLAQRLRSRINADGEILVRCQEERSQQANRNRAMENLNSLVSRALTILPKRRKTAVPGREKRKRLEEKRRHSEKKRLRKFSAE